MTPGGAGALDGGEIYAAAERFRRELAARDQAALGRLVRAYGVAWRRIEGELNELLAVLAAERAEAARQGRPYAPGVFQVMQRERLQALRAQVEREVRALAEQADAQTRAEQAAVIEAAQTHAERYTQMQLADLQPGVRPAWNRLPNEAFKDLVGFAGDGSPLPAVFGSLPGQAGQALEEALLSGMALGQNPREIARQVRRAAGGNLARLLTIARTETARAQREASHRSFEANSAAVGSWVWMSAHSLRTCAACWALHGSVHPLAERMADHPNGRCTPAPVTKTWRELGFDLDETQAPIETGPARFARLPADQQRQILGPAAFEAYRAGRVQLPDFVGLRHSAQWGPTHYVRSLRAMVGPEEARQWTERAAQARRERRQNFTIEGVRVTEERRRHWRERHPEVTEAIENALLHAGLQRAAVVARSRRDPETELLYFQDEQAKWWVLKVTRPAGQTPFVLTLHRVRKPGK